MKVALAACLGFLFLALGAGAAPGHGLDSLKGALVQTWQSDPQAASKGLRRYAALALEEGNKEEFAWALNFQGVVLGAIGAYDSSYHYYALCLGYCQAHGIMEVERKTRMNLAINFQYQGRYRESAVAYLEALHAFEEAGDTLGMGHVHSGLGGVSNYLGDRPKAIAHYRMAIACYTAIGADALTGIVWSNLGTMYRDSGMRDSAATCFDIAERVLGLAGNQLGLANLHANLGGLYEADDRERAIAHYEKGLGIATTIDYPRGRLLNAAGMARLWLVQGRPALAIPHGEEALALAEGQGDLQMQADALRVLQEACAASGRMALAHAHLLRLKHLEDSIAGENTKRAVAELEIKYRTARQDKALAEQREQLANKELAAKESSLAYARLSLWLTAVAAALALTLALGGLWWWTQSQKRKRLLLELETTRILEAERRAKEVSEEKLKISRELHDNVGSQITYIVSALDNLAYYGKAPEALAEAGKIAGYGREALADLRHAIWALHLDAGFADVARRITEIALRHFPAGMLEIDSAVTEDRRLGTGEAIHILRVVQEALHNAAKYAACSRVTLRLHCDARAWSIRIADDGTGFDLSSPPAGEGTGLAGMAARAAAIGARLSVLSGMGKGTTVLLEKP